MIAYEEPENGECVYLSFMELKLNEIFLSKKTELELSAQSFIQEKKSFLIKNDVLKNLETGEGFGSRISSVNSVANGFLETSVKCFKFNHLDIPNPAIHYHILSSVKTTQIYFFRFWKF